MAHAVSTSVTAKAKAAIEERIDEPGRKALTRKEALALGHPQAACDRAIRQLRDEKRICRFGAGVYGIGRTKLVEAAPEALAALGYTVLPSTPVKGYSQRLGGTVLRLDRPCRRVLRGRGVRLSFETPNGRLIRSREPAMSAMDAMPRPGEVEDHYHRFDYCHSLARAEKDLLVHKALDAMEAFRAKDVRLAIDGGTALVCYYRAFPRFSEDLVIRLMLSSGTPVRGSPERIALVHEVGREFASHIEEALPWLRRTRKGCIRKDGIVQSFIFDYDGRHASEAVQHGIKFELVDLSTRMPTIGLRRNENQFPAVHILEIVARKWKALAGRLPERSDSYADLVRHVHDIALLLPHFQGPQAEALRELVFSGDGFTNETVEATLEELRTNPRWQDHYRSYMQRMGMRQLSSFPGNHPLWRTVLAQVGDAAERSLLLG